MSQQQQNPYAAQPQQTYTAVPGMGAVPPQQQQQGGVGGYTATGAYQQYGQQDGYDTRGAGGAGGVVQQVGMNGTGVSDFWAEVSSFETIRTRSARGKKGVRQADFFIDRVTLGQLTATNASLNEMQDAIQQVRQAHVASLVSLLSPAQRRRRRRSDDNPDPPSPPPPR